MADDSSVPPRPGPGWWILAVRRDRRGHRRSRCYWPVAGHESTDDAQIDGRITQIATRVGGTVIEGERHRQPVRREPAPCWSNRSARLPGGRWTAPTPSWPTPRPTRWPPAPNVPIATVSTPSDVRTARVAALDEAQAAIAVADGQVDARKAQRTAAEARAARAAGRRQPSADRDVERLKPLVAKEEIAQQQFDAAVATADAARAAVDAAAVRPGAPPAPRWPSPNSGRCRRGRRRPGPKRRSPSAKTAPEQVQVTRARAAAADARVKQAARLLAQAQLNLERTVIKAPIDGIVGSKVGRGRPGRCRPASRCCADRRRATRCGWSPTSRRRSWPTMQPGQAAAHRSRRVRRPDLPRHGRQHRRGHRREVQPAAARERHRQLRQGGAARAGEDRARRPARTRIIGCAPACRWCRRSTRSERRWTRQPSATVNPWIVAVAVMFATFMEVLDTTVVNVSLPHIAGNLSATIDESTWVLTSYLVANAIILPLTGWLATTFGRKRLLMASVTGLHARRRCSAASRRRCRCSSSFRILQGADRRRDAAAVAGGAARGVPAAGARQGDGLLGPRHRRRADSRAGARRLADRQLQLALGLLHQPAGRHRLAGDDAGSTSSIRRTCARERRASTTGASACWRCGSARCSSCSTSASSDDWFASPFITTLVVMSAAAPGRLPRARVAAPTSR